MFDALESERLKVAALNFFHPTASPPLPKIGFFILRHSLLRGEGREGVVIFILRGAIWGMSV
jgi:hypothetical protein